MNKWIRKIVEAMLLLLPGGSSVLFLHYAIRFRDTYLMVVSLFMFVVMMMFYFSFKVDAASRRIK